MDVKEHELNGLARHMGHTLTIHRKYYQLPRDTTEIAKVGKLLMAVEKGLDHFKGKTLDEIELSDME